MKTIIAHPRFEYMADEIVRNNPETIWKGQALFQRFRDRTPDLKFPWVKDEIEHQDVTYIGDFSNPEELFEHYNAIFWLVKNTADKVRIIMPYFPMGTSERIEEKWETETAHAFSNLISSLPSGRSAKNSVHIFDIHALVEQSIFNLDRINTELHNTMSLLDIGPEEMVVFPDEWAAKRFRKYIPGVPQERRIICGKERVGDDRIVTIKEGDPRGKDCILIDDLIQTGTTLIQTAKVLRAKWARSVRAYAAHGVFPDDSHKRVAAEFDELIVTDSIPANIARAHSLSNMRVLSLSSLIEKIILKGK